MLITLDEEEIVPWAEEQGIEDTSIAALASDPQVRALIQAELDRANAKYAQVEQVKKFVILDHDLSQETGELTPTLKVKRNVVNEKYAEVLDALRLTLARRVLREVRGRADLALDVADAHVAGPGQQLTDPVGVAGVVGRGVVRAHRGLVAPAGDQDELAGIGVDRPGGQRPLAAVGAGQPRRVLGQQVAQLARAPAQPVDLGVDREAHTTGMVSCGAMASQSPPPRFVVGLHDATTLHFDLRLQFGGVAALLGGAEGAVARPGRQAAGRAGRRTTAWRPGLRGRARGATRGSGAVIIWDEGTFDAARASATGTCPSSLDGHKLHGGVRA